MLAGTLNDVSLPEVLSLLSHAQKTGSIHVTGDGLRGRIDLIAGAIGMAQSRVGKLGLVRRLVARGLLEAASLSEGLPAAAATPDPDIQLVRSAYRAGSVTADQVREVVHLHIIDAMFDLGRVEAGRFRFDPCRVADLGVQRSPEEVLDDVAVRTEQWEEVRATIPAPGAIVRMLPRIEQDEVAITPGTWRLLSLIDGRRTVAELVDAIGDGEFEVSNALHRLVEAGLIEVSVNIGDRETPDVGVDHVLPLEMELATLRSDVEGKHAGHLDWDLPDSAPPSRGPSTGTADTVVRQSDDDHAKSHDQSAEVSNDTVEVEATSSDDEAGANDVEKVTPIVAAVSASTSDEAVADEPAGSETAPGEPVTDEFIGTNDAAEEPAVFEAGDPDSWSSGGVAGEDDDAFDADEPEVFSTVVEDAEEGKSRSERRRERRASSRKVSLAATSERHGRLLPEPEPGHDAADLTRRLLEGVGKS